MLNLEGLTSLEILRFEHNQITKFNLKELIKLHVLYCQKNELSDLNLEGFTLLRCFNCDDNPLKVLNLTGVNPNIKSKYAKLEEKLQLEQLQSIQPDSDEIMTSIPEQVNPFLPTANNKKRARNENGMILNQSEEESSDNEPEFKRHRHI